MQLAPVICCHTPEAFESRVWEELEHRTLAYHVVNMIVLSSSTNQQAAGGKEAAAAISGGTDAIDPTDILGFSFLAFSPCKTRSQFVTTLAHLCLMIEDSKSVKNNRMLKESFHNRFNQPSTLHKLAMTMQKRPAEVESDINKVFEFLRNQRCARAVSIVDTKDNGQPPGELGWYSIKARVFVIWLKFTAQANLQAALTFSGKKVQNNAANRNDTAASSTTNCPPSQESVAAIPQGDNPPPIAQASQTVGTIGLEEFLGASEVVQQPPAPRNVPVEVRHIVPTNIVSPGVAMLPATEPAAGVSNNRSNLHTVMSELCNEKDRIAGLRPIGQAEMDELVKSYLFIYTERENYVLQLAPIEVYSAGNLRSYNHERITGLASSPASDFGLESLPSYKMILSSAASHIDLNGDILHVLRPGDARFKDLARKAFFIDPHNQLVKILLELGSEDKDRSPGSVRLNFGCGGLSFEPETGAPTKLVGIRFLEKLDMEEQAAFLSQVGTLVEFIWHCMQDMQLRSRKCRLATNVLCNQYSNELCDFLKMSRDIPIENVTLSLSSLHPIVSQCLIHKDRMNDPLYSYSKTGSLNLVYTDDTQAVFLLQVIINFRSVVSHYCMPSPTAINGVICHVKLYEENLNAYYQQLFGGWVSPAAIPTVFDRTNFWIGDELPFENVDIYHGPSKSKSGKQAQKKANDPHPPVMKDLLLMPIGISRTMSMSMAIDPLRKLISMEALNFLQVVELCFVVSLLNQPLRFHHVMMHFVEKAKEDEDFEFDYHPYNNWIRQTKLMFGGKWQGGPYHRYSPHCCKDIDDLFGNEVGRHRLNSVVGELSEFLVWIDSQAAKDFSDGMIPVDELDSQTTQCLQAIDGCDFGYFRLAIFMTVAIGCGITTSGRHLRQLYLPAKGTAAYAHLRKPRADTMSANQARELASTGNQGTTTKNDGASVTIHRGRFDEMMREISAGMGCREYFRDEIECILCEGHPDRPAGKKEWYCRGLTLYDIDCDGKVICKKYGYGNRWEFAESNHELDEEEEDEDNDENKQS